MRERKVFFKDAIVIRNFDQVRGPCSTMLIKRSLDCVGISTLNATRERNLYDNIFYVQVRVVAIQPGKDSAYNETFKIGHFLAFSCSTSISRERPCGGRPCDAK